MIDMTYNGKSPSDFDAYLANIPVITHAERKRTTFDIPMRDGLLYAEEYSGDANIDVTIHLRDNAIEQKMREVRSWLTGSGRLTFSNRTDSFFEVKAINPMEESRKPYDYGRYTASMILYPYEFLNSGDEELLAGTDSLENEAEASKPLYRITGDNGTYILTVNGESVSVKITDNRDTYIDTRKVITYQMDGNNKIASNTLMSGDYENLLFKKGENIVTITGADAYVKPRWGYVI